MSANSYILIVDDDRDIVELLDYNLRKQGFRTEHAYDGEEALTMIRREKPDLMILDLMMPVIGGMELCGIIRRDKKLKDMNIVMLTARTEDSEIIDGLEMGADDYVTKPFSPKVLLAKVNAVLRRKPSLSDEIDKSIFVSGIEIRPHSREVFLDGQIIDLTKSEFNILSLLAGREGWVFSRSQIMDDLVHSDQLTSERTVDVHITSLRKKLRKYSSVIETVRGVGYRMKEVE